jgi:hypothetical protein
MYYVEIRRNFALIERELRNSSSPDAAFSVEPDQSIIQKLPRDIIVFL